MKININIEVSPSELIELQDVAHEGSREVVTKLSSEGIARKILEYLEETPNQMAYHIPADHMETGTVIQGKPTREPEAAEPEYRVGDLVELHWEGKKSDSPNVLYRITELHDNGTVSLRPNTFPSFEVVNISKEWISRPLRKVELRGDDEWIVPDTDSPQPTPPRPMRSFDTRIQTGDIVIIQPFTGHNEIFVVLSANNEKALLHSENNEIKIVDLYKLLRVWPDPESVYGVCCSAIAVEPPKE